MLNKSSALQVVFSYLPEPMQVEMQLLSKLYYRRTEETIAKVESIKMRQHIGGNTPAIVFGGQVTHHLF